MPTAFDTYDLAGLTLSNRIVMAPMTRSRAYGDGATPTPLMATYYAQRAGAGLIVTEGIQPSVVGQGYPDTPGLHSDAQIDAWREVTDAVHQADGRIFAQLMHAGRIGHADLLPGDLTPVGPSEVAAEGTVYTHAGPRAYPVPHALTEAEILATVDDFAAAARNAMRAGFDGVELHGANGYLIHQFLAPSANRRTDAWGGPVGARIRFALEVVRAVVDAIGAEHVGIRLSPRMPFQSIVEPDAEDTYLALVREFDGLGLAYLHIAEAPGQRALTRAIREAYSGTVILNPDTMPAPTGPDAVALIENGLADLVSWGALFLANPDLPRRLAQGGPFAQADRSKAFGGDHRGYTDYPALVG